MILEKLPLKVNDALWFVIAKYAFITYMVGHDLILLILSMNS